MGTSASESKLTSNQRLAGIDLSQAASDIGYLEQSPQPPEGKELRQQCTLHQDEINFLQSLGLPDARPNQYRLWGFNPNQLWLGRGGTEFKPLLPDAQPRFLRKVRPTQEPEALKRCGR